MKLKRTGTTARQRKATLRKILESRDHEALMAWSRSERQAVRTVFSALFDPDELLRWRAIEGLGLLAGQESHRDLERVREWLRRLLWNMNDESGGLMWHGAEAIGEILMNVDQLIGEFVMILHSFHREEPFEAGTYSALARLASREPERVAPFVPFLQNGLTDSDPRIRAHAARILGLVGANRTDHPAWDEVLADQTPLTVYDHDQGELHQTTVSAHAHP
jgi:HEAT repeat protein